MLVMLLEWIQEPTHIWIGRNKEITLNIELDYIKSLLSLAKDNDISELKIKDGDKKIVIKKIKEQLVVTTPQTVKLPAVHHVQTADAPAKPEAVEGTKKESQLVEEEIPEKVVKSPMVGTFYRAPSPGSPPFVEIGSKVKVGQVVCIIESMKLMNEIESDFEGTITKICIENSDPVENGTVLMHIE